MLKYRDTPNEMVGLIISEELHLNCRRNEKNRKLYYRVSTISLLFRKWVACSYLNKKIITLFLTE